VRSSFLVFSASVCINVLALVRSSKKITTAIDLSDDEWLSVISLAGEWGFQEILEFATEKLKDHTIDPVAKINIAQTYNIQEWLYSSYASLVMRDAPLTDDEADTLGARLSMKLSRTREIVMRTKLLTPTQAKDSNYKLAATVIQALVETFGPSVKTYLKENDRVFLDVRQPESLSLIKARSIGAYKPVDYGAFNMSLETDEVVEVLECGVEDPRMWTIRKKDGSVGIAHGSYLMPAKSYYAYTAKARIVDASLNGAFPRQLKVTKNQIVEVDNSLPDWFCLPARVNGVEGFIFKSYATIV